MTIVLMILVVIVSTLLAAHSITRFNVKGRRPNRRTAPGADSKCLRGALK
jgi:hypothetical protein